MELFHNETAPWSLIMIDASEFLTYDLRLVASYVGFALYKPFWWQQEELPRAKPPAGGPFKNVTAPQQITFRACYQKS
jgi:hypothetical protein